MEQWRDVVGYESLYKVSDEGRVMTINSGRIHLGDTAILGYRRVVLTGGKRFLVHRLVAAAFIGKCPDGMQVNHKNGIPSDNRLGNLEYVTASENHIHRCRVLKTHYQKGSLHGLHKLVEEEVIKIIDRTAKGDSLNLIAADFNVCIATVSLIARNKTWRNITRDAQPDRRLSYSGLPPGAFPIS